MMLTIFTIVLSLLKLVLANLMLKPLLVEYHRDQLWVLYYSYFTSMTYLIALKSYRFVYLLMIQIYFLQVITCSILSPL